MYKKLVNYLKESKEEMKKVVWPTRQQTTRYTIMVIGLTVVMAAFLGTLDLLFTMLLDQLV